MDRFRPESGLAVSSDGSVRGAQVGVVTVAELNRAVAALLDRSFAPVWVSGEISNLTRAASGHWYFTLKDAQASVRAVMFRGRNQLVAFNPANGDRVEARAQAGLYEARGEFQLNVEALRQAGAGDLFQRFLQIKSRLEAEGLFEASRKRVPPAVVRTLGIVTSLQAAALRDVLTTLARRAPQVRVIIYPASVQGAQAPAELIRAMLAAGSRAECEVLLLVRGGGSIEDLWAFNDERLARVIADSPIPVISGVGHETDFTIADFVADLRAPTPTAAAVSAAPDRLEQLAMLDRDRRRLMQAWRRQNEQREQRLDTATRLLRPPSLQWAQRLTRLDQLAQRLATAGVRSTDLRQARLMKLASALRTPQLAAPRSRLEAVARALASAARVGTETAAQRLLHAGTALELVSPRGVLQRGYAIVTLADGPIVRSAATLSIGDKVSVALGDGAFDATVDRLHADAHTDANADANTDTNEGPGLLRGQPGH